MVRLLSAALTATSQLAGVVAVIALAFLVSTATIDVIARLMNGRSLFYGLVEYGEVALVTLAFFGAARAQLTDGHVASTLVYDALPRRFSHGAYGAALVLIAALLLWAGYVAAGVAVDSFERNEIRFGLVQVPLWPGRALIPVSLALISLLLLRESAHQFRQLITNNDDDDPHPERGWVE